jgi:hypothetical protein
MSEEALPAPFQHVLHEVRLECQKFHAQMTLIMMQAQALFDWPRQLIAEVQQRLSQQQLSSVEAQREQDRLVQWITMRQRVFTQPLASLHMALIQPLAETRRTCEQFAAELRKEFLPGE